MRLRPSFTSAAFAITCLALPATTLAAFSDLPNGSAAYDAVEYLSAKGIVNGYPDGTFKPSNPVNRAELAKLLVTSRNATPSAEEFNGCFPDVQKEWFAAYVCYAKAQGWLGGYPDGSFKPAATVTKAEAMKMMLEAQAMDENSYGEIRLPLSDDVNDPNAWYYPYMRLGIATSMTMIGTDGTLGVSRTLDRQATSLLLFRLLTFKEGRRSQALLNEVESEIIITDQTLLENFVQAEYASARGLLAARGALATAPDAALVKAVVKIAESYRALVRALAAGREKNYDETIRLDGDAWNLAAKAKEMSSDANIVKISEQIQLRAQQMANDAREAKAKAAGQ